MPEPITVTVSITLKADDRAHAERILKVKLKQWHHETMDTSVPYPSGTLLCHTIKEPVPSHLEEV